MTIFVRRTAPPEVADWSRDEARPSAAALADVYEAHVDYLYRCLRALGLSDAAAQDAVHDVFLVVQRKLPTFEGEAPSALRNWLYGIAIRIARRQRARMGREVASDPDLGEQLPAAGPAPDASAERSQAVDLLARVLDQLDEERREVFVLSEIEQLSAPEIADLTAVGVNTVYSRLRLARRDFERALRRLRARRGDRR
jgi:RNA polymerase sigma-70 factor (ECF subfamily)